MKLVNPPEKVFFFPGSHDIFSGYLVSSQYNMLKNWLEVEVAPDIRGRVPLLLLSLNTKVRGH